MAVVDVAARAQMERDVGYVRSHKQDFNPRFADWLLANHATFLDFADAGDKVWERGFTEYSAYVITNVLRYRADVRGTKFSMTNTFTPDIARLYNATRRPLFKTSTRFGKEACGE